MKNLIFLIITLALGCHANAQKRMLTPNDIYQLKTVGNGQISPDGKWVAYTVTTVDSAKDKRNTDIWMISWDGTDPVQLTNSPDGETNPKWSPDGKYLSFTSSREGNKNQVYLLNRMGGEAQKFTDVKGDLNDYAWSPDGTKLLLTIKGDSDTSKTKKPMIIDRYQFKQDVEGYRYKNDKSHLYLFTLENKKLDTLTSGSFNESDAEWSPDGTSIAFVSNHTDDPDKNRNSDIFIINVAKGSIPRQLTTWKGSDNNPKWSPDGKTISYLRSTSDANYFMYDQPILCTIAASGGEPKLLTKSLDRPVTGQEWSKDGASIIALVADDCIRKMASFNTLTGAMSNLISGNQSVQNIALHPSGNWLASISDPMHPAELYTIENNQPKPLTKTNDEFIKQIQLASVEKIISKSKDGISVSNLLFIPGGKEKSNLPAIFFIHGGPVAQDEFNFDFTRQILAAQGYAVVAVNYRGSNGKGIEFCKSIYADWGNKEVLDIQGAANHLIAQKIIDSTRMGIGGWSYGGILTDYTIAKDTRFKAAASGAGSALQLSLYGVDQYILQLDNELGQPWKDNNFQKYLKMSYPFLNADKIKTP
ncbi:MAG: S9 family peptidase, partial [Saprospiraceae bacterium]